MDGSEWRMSEEMESIVNKNKKHFYTLIYYMTNTNILETLPKERQNKKRKLISIIVIAILLVLFITFIVAAKVLADNDDTDSRQIAEYEYQINELRKQKEVCFDNLSYEESKSAFQWFTKPCIEWDEQIMELREKADALKDKSYMGLN